MNCVCKGVLPSTAMLRWKITFSASVEDGSLAMPRLTFGGRVGETPRSGTGFGEIEREEEEAVEEEVDIMATCARRMRLEMIRISWRISTVSIL